MRLRHRSPAAIAGNKLSTLAAVQDFRALSDFGPGNRKTKLARFLLDLDARLDSGVFASGRRARESYERFAAFMDRFHVAGFRRLCVELTSDGVTFAALGMIAMLALAVPAFQETADDDWLKKSELAVTFLDRYGNEVGARGIRHNDAIPLEEFPDHLIKAVLATEDRRFYEHFGIDFAGTFRALGANARAGGVVQGGSSLTQQLAKNLFLSNERTIERKIKEAFLAFWLESRLSKNEILKLYLDRAYMGGGAVGVDAAAQFYFGKSARDVTLAEAAMLAGLFKAPTKYAPHVNLPAARARANVVLDNLVEAGFMTEGQVFGARRNPATSVDRRDERQPNYYLDWAFDEVKKLIETLPKSVTERVFVVRLGLDVNIQREAENVVETAIRQYGQEYRAKQAAMVLMDTDGTVRALVGGADYGASQFNRATDALRQPGSSFKPYVYATALAHGFKPTTIVRDEAICLGNWCPSNYNEKFAGAMTLTTALVRSINTIPVRLSVAIGDGNPKKGRAEIIKTARRMGLRTPLPDSSSLPIGAAEVTVLDHTGGFTAFPNGGMAAAPHGNSGSAHRRRRNRVALRPRRQEARAGDLAAGGLRDELHDEQGRGGRHRPQSHPGRHQGGRKNRHDQRLSGRLVCRLHGQLRSRRVGRQRRLQPDQPAHRRFAAGADLAPGHELRASGRGGESDSRRRARSDAARAADGRAVGGSQQAGQQCAGGTRRAAGGAHAARWRNAAADRTPYGGCVEGQHRRRLCRLRRLPQHHRRRRIGAER